MKNFLLLLAVYALSLPHSAYSQSFNHVPNCSFEDYSQCPTGYSQVNRATGWRQYTNGSSDYFNCAFISTFGYQVAAHGQAYAGGYQYYRGHTFQYKEYIAREIIPLQPGKAYEVSMSVSLANNCKFGTADLGVYFYDSGPTTVNTSDVLNVTPQVSFASNGPIIDTQNWVRVSKVFVADSAYDNIVIGGFSPYNTIVLDSIGTNFTFNYYYFDSIVIRPYDSFSIASADTMLCAGDTFTVDVITPITFNGSNIFTAQLSNKTGSFANPVNIGTLASDTSGPVTCVVPANISPGTGYRVRVLASAPADTSLNLGPAFRIGNPDSTNIAVSNNSPICEGTTLQFSASTFVSGTTYSWAGPNSFSSSSPNPVILGAAPVQNGNYMVTMKWYGCEVTDTTTVTVKPMPGKPTAGSNSPMCAGNAINLTASSATSGVSYSWIGPGYSSSTQNPSISNSTVSMSGDYIVTATLDGCSRTDTATVLVKFTPASVTLSNNGPICAGDTLKLNSSASTTGVSYTWVGPNSFGTGTQNGAVANATPAATGWYKMTVDMNGCTYIDSTYAVVNPIPATPTLSYNNPLCLGETLNLTASTVSGASYTWAGPGSYGANTQNTSRLNMSWNDTGTYSVVTSIGNCAAPAATIKVNMNPVPFVVIFPTPGDSICVGDAVTFTALPNNAGGTPQYRWVVNGQTAGTNSTVFTTSTLNNGDIVRCDMTENTKCSSPYTDQSNDVNMIVLPWLAPSVIITANPTRPLKVDEYVSFTATTTNAGANPRFQWKRNGQDVQGATGSVWSANTLNDNDSISVEIISGYKCPQPTTAVSNGIRVKILTSIDNNIAGVSGLVLYPNPNNGKFVLKGRVSTEGEYKIEIINALGQVVYTKPIRTNGTMLYAAMQVDNLPAGLYLLKLYDRTNYFSTRKFRVE